MARKGRCRVEVSRRGCWRKPERGPDASEEVLVIFRERQEDGTIKHDYSLSNGPWETPIE